MTSKTTLLLSGGIDSMVCLMLLLDARHRVDAIYFDYGQAAAKPEHDAAKLIATQFNVPFSSLSLGLGKNFGRGEILYRNAVLILTTAMATADRTDQIAVGIHGGTPYPDCSEEFLESVRATVNASSQKRLGIVAPLKTWQKSEIIAFAIDKHLPIQLTYSCEEGVTPPCGNCMSCNDRLALPC